MMDASWKFWQLFKNRGSGPFSGEKTMKFYIVKVGNIKYRDLQPCSVDAVIAAMQRFPNASRISVKVAV